jgi:hypothetical protein
MGPSRHIMRKNILKSPYLELCFFPFFFGSLGGGGARRGGSQICDVASSDAHPLSIFNQIWQNSKYETRKS